MYNLKYKELNSTRDGRFGEGKCSSDFKLFSDKSSNNWIGPFVMAAINTKIVRRSNSLSNYSYRKD